MQSPYNYWLLEKSEIKWKFTSFAKRTASFSISWAWAKFCGLSNVLNDSFSSLANRKYSLFWSDKERIICFSLNDRESSFLHLSKVRGRSAFSMWQCMYVACISNFCQTYQSMGPSCCWGRSGTHSPVEISTWIMNKKILYKTLVVFFWQNRLITVETKNISHLSSGMLS